MRSGRPTRAAALALSSELWRAGCSLIRVKATAAIDPRTTPIAELRGWASTEAGNIGVLRRQLRSCL
jgi:hypothetical protein